MKYFRSENPAQKKEINDLIFIDMESNDFEKYLYLYNPIIG